MKAHLCPECDFPMSLVQVDAWEDRSDYTYKCYQCGEKRIYQSAPKTRNTPSTVRDYHVGESDYSQHKIQPWDIWLEYSLDPWDADIIKRVLRQKKGEDRVTAYKKIIHVCEEKIRQLEEKPK